MAFLSMGFLELVHCFNIKSEKSLFKVDPFENKYLVGSFILGILIQSIVVIVPIFANIFKVVQLDLNQWLITICISILPIPIIELQKKIEMNDIEKKHNVKISHYVE